MQVHRHQRLKVYLAAAIHLPDAGDARRHQQAIAVAIAILLHLVAQGRTRADDAHVAAQHVEKLRQLVQAGGADKAADARDARIFSQLKFVATVLTADLLALHEFRYRLTVNGVVRVGAHAAKLKDLKGSASFADALLME